MRLRSANRGNAYNTWYVNASGNVNNNNASYANRCAPIVPWKPAVRKREALFAGAQKTQGAELPAARLNNFLSMLRACGRSGHTREDKNDDRQGRDHIF